MIHCGFSELRTRKEPQNDNERHKKLYFPFQGSANVGRYPDSIGLVSFRAMAREIKQDEFIIQSSHSNPLCCPDFTLEHYLSTEIDLDLITLLNSSPDVIRVANTA